MRGARGFPLQEYLQALGESSADNRGKPFPGFIKSARNKNF